MRPDTDFTRALRFLEGHRILVLGGSGWLGMTALRLLTKCQPEALLITSSDGRIITLDGANIQTVQFIADIVESFRPTVVLNFAAVTRDRIDTLGDELFTATNQRLFEQYMWATSQRSVVMSMHISSGAATRPDSRNPRLNPYGHQKWQEECAILGAIAEGRRIQIARVWSVTGDLVTRPETYAFSDLIVQGLRSGRIRVRAQHEVWRRYTAADRYLSVAMASCWDEMGPVLDSGGERVEIRELALIIGELTRSQVDASPASGPADDYCSDGRVYLDHCARFGLTGETVREQAERVSRAMRASLGI